MKIHKSLRVVLYGQVLFAMLLVSALFILRITEVRPSSFFDWSLLIYFSAVVFIFFAALFYLQYRATICAMKEVKLKWKLIFALSYIPFVGPIWLYLHRYSKSHAPLSKFKFFFFFLLLEILCLIISSITLLAAGFLPFILVSIPVLILWFVLMKFNVIAL
jgi:hypothetical protein